MKVQQAKWAQVTLISVFFLLCLVAIVNSSFGLADLELIRAFSNDEATLIGNVMDMTLYSPGELYYGNGYRLFPVLFLYLCKWLGCHIDVQFIAMVLRMQSLIGGVAGVALMVLILRELKVSRALSFLGAMFLFTVPDYFHWSQTVHPDTLQTALILGAFLVVLKDHSFKAALWGSAILGLACGSKFGGMLLLPFIFLPHALTEWRANSRPLSHWLLGITGRGLLFLVPFALAFMVLIPYGVTHPLEFVQRFQYVRGDMWGINSFRPYRWLITLGTQSGVLGGVLLTLGLVTYGFFLWRSWSEKKLALLDDKDFRNHLTISVTALFSLAIIMAISRMYNDLRYTYWFYPLIVVMCFYGLHHYANQRQGKAIALLLLALVVIRGGDSIRSENFASRKPIADEVVANQFIQTHYPTSTRFFKEWYAYVNPAYNNIIREWFVSRQMIDERESEVDVLVFSKGSSGRYAWKAPGTTLSQLKFVRDEKRNLDADAVQALFTYLLSPDSHWRLVYDGDTVVIFEKKGFGEEKRIGSNP